MYFLAHISSSSVHVLSVPRVIDLLGEDGDKSVPVRVWLYPLDKLVSKTERTIRNIGLNSISKAELEFQDLDDLQLKMDDLRLHNATVQNLPNLRNALDKMHRNFKMYLLSFKHAISEVLPKIRSGGATEEELLEIFRQRAHCPYSSPALGESLRIKEIEATVSVL